MDILFLLLSLVILMVLCMKGVNIFLSVFVTSIFMVVTAGLNPVDSMLNIYAPGLGKYFGGFFFIFILGAIFGKMMSISGAADSIAMFIINKFGEKFVVPSLVIACAVLAYGGVSVFVALFTVYSMMVSMFKKANLPRRLIPVVYFSGAGTFAVMLPGSPQIHNLIPMKFLGTTATAGLVPGVMTGIFEAVLVFLYLAWLFKRVKASGEGWTDPGAAAGTAPAPAATATAVDKKMPNVLIAFAPMIALLLALNVFKLDPALAMFLGIVAGLVFYAPYIDWKAITKNIAAGTMDGTMSLFNTAVIVGFGALVTQIPAFQQTLDALVNSGLNPLVGIAIAVGALVFISGSGSGALSIAMPMLAGIYLPMGADPEALHRVATMASLSTTPPFNGLIITVFTLCAVTHKEAYIPVGIAALLIPLISTAFMLLLFTMGL